MEHRITDIHCPQCGAPADFDIVKQIYVCGHCGGTVGITEAQKEKQGFRSLQQEKLKNSAKKYRLFRTSCSGCGAEVVFEENEALSGSRRKRHAKGWRTGAGRTAANRKPSSCGI